MTWVAVAVGGSSLIGGLISGNAAKSAAQQQSDASLAAAQLQQQTANGQIDYLKGQQANTQGNLNGQLTDMQGNLGSGFTIADTSQRNLYNSGVGTATDAYGRAINTLQPYQDAGAAGATTLASMIPQLTQTFGPDQLKANLDPNYSFMMGQGLGAVKQGLNVNGGGSNINTGATKFAEDYANNAYQNAFNNWNTQNNSIYNRLAGIAGLGTTSNATGAGLATGYGSNVGSMTNSTGSTLAGLSTGYSGLGTNYNLGITGLGTQYNLGQGGNITNLATGGAAAGAAGLTGSAMANASGTVGSANALTSGLTGAANGVLLSSLLKPSATTTPQAPAPGYAANAPLDYNFLNDPTRQ